MDKNAAAQVLEQIASFVELSGDDAKFRVRAFRNAAHAVAGFDGDFEAAVRSGELLKTRGVGKATFDVIRELVEQGRSSYLETLRSQVPPGLIDMMRIGGLGLARVKLLHAQLGISSVAELEQAAREGRLAAVPRFGRKSTDRLLRGIEYLRRTGEQYLLHHALRQAGRLAALIRAFPGVSAADVAGSVRRRLELVRDIDIAVATEDPALVADRLAALPTVREVVGRGDARFSVQFHSGVPGRIHTAPAAMFGHLLARATGSKTHLAQLQAHAASRGLGLDEHGLTRDGIAVPCPDESALYRALGMPVIPPELREGLGEVALAVDGRLPVLLERSDMQGLLHCHTQYSDGTNTVAELARGCHAAGYSYVGITDHSETASYAGGLTEADLIRQHEEIDAFNASQDDIRVLKGIEADIRQDGSLDYSVEFLRRFDFVICSIHSRFEMDKAAMTGRMLKAVDNPRTNIIGHPTGRLLLSRDPYGIDMPLVIERARERGVAIEINADPHRLDMDWRCCIDARNAGIQIPIGADAHSIAGLEYVELGVSMARKAGLTKDDVLNARSVEGFLRHASERR